MQLVIDTVCDIFTKIWNRIYTLPIEVIVYNVTDNISTTPAHYETKYIPGKMEYVPRMVTRTIGFGINSRTVTETQYESRLTDGKFRSNYIPESRMYFVTATCLSYPTAENDACLCKSNTV
jgi:hypothetical protein